jgi:hypothetical protein
LRCSALLTWISRATTFDFNVVFNQQRNTGQWANWRILLPCGIAGSGRNLTASLGDMQQALAQRRVSARQLTLFALQRIADAGKV